MNVDDFYPLYKKFKNLKSKFINRYYRVNQTYHTLP